MQIYKPGYHYFNSNSKFGGRKGGMVRVRFVSSFLLNKHICIGF